MTAPSHHSPHSLIIQDVEPQDAKIFKLCLATEKLEFLEALTQALNIPA